MKAQTMVWIGVGALMVLAPALYFVHSKTQTKEIIPPTEKVPGLVLGASINSVAGVDHALERYIAPPGRKTIVDQLKAINVTLYPEDEYTAIPDPSFGIGSEIEIVRANLITIIDAKKPTTYRTWLPTVGELFKQQQIVLEGSDRMTAKPDSQLTDKLTITITRVGTREVAEPEPIAFNSTKQNDSTMEKGATKPKQVGQNGVRTKTYRITYEDGIQVSKNIIKNEITTKPIDQITLVGTKIVTFGSGEATWYAWKPGGAAHNTLPFGTKVHVVNLTNGKSVDVTINDRGIQGSAIIDLDKAAFAAIAPLGAGRINVRLEKVYP